ncbi:prenyltransferase [Halovenus salina]|uniref:Prenyltransferase n=2 Tax=Halovenus salina TaxID=1510225 RepID=A0ABD5W352_9EURY|nr:prenyltransferase [Halovenus salina]
MGVRTVAYVVFQTSRPSQLLLIAGVYLLGVVIAAANGVTPAGSTVFVGLFPLLCCSASVHYANEFADVETDAQTDRTPFSGGSGALAETGLSRSVPLIAGLLSLGVGLGSALVLWTSGWLSTQAGRLLLVIVAAGWQYSVRPLKLAWRGLGEVTNAALGGLILPVYGAAVVGGPLGTVALASLPFALVVLLNLFATQWPDRAADAAVGKRTLAVRWSRRRLRIAYIGIAIVAGISLVGLYVVPSPPVLPRPVVLASLPVAPLVVWAAGGYTRRRVPLPTVAAMVTLAALQLFGWLWTIY